MERHRYALRILYEGGAFRGFQRQPDVPTVQECLRAALARLSIRSRIDVAARTDAGVHALSQVVGFSARRSLDPEELRAAVNRATPSSLLCLEARTVPPSFHARASAASRHYVYLVGLPPPEPLAPYAWSLPDPRSFPGPLPARLDADAMRRALSDAVGEHDFAGLARGGGRRAAVHRLLSAQVLEADFAPLYALLLEGRGFARALVRNLAGTAVAVGLGLAPASRVAELLAARGRYPGVRAPGHGLTLARVTYPPGALGT